MKKHIFLLSGIALFLMGCALTDIKSVSSFDSEKRQYSKILILSSFQDLRYKDVIESAFQQACLRNNILAATGSEILPPVREYSQDEITKRFRERNIEGLLIVALQEYWESSVAMPSITTTTGTAVLIGNILNYSEQQQSLPELVFTMPNANFDSRFFDGETGQAVWRATSLSAGDVFSDFSSLAKSLAATTVAKLLNDKILIPSLANSSAISSSYMAPPKSLTEALTLYNEFYIKGDYPSAISGLSSLKPYLDQYETRGTDRLLLSKIYFLWGSCFIKAYNRPDLAVLLFEKTLNQNPDYRPDKSLFDTTVISLYEKYKNDFWVPRIALKEKELSEKNEAQSKEIGAREKDIADNVRRGEQIRIIKSGATLRVQPDFQSLIIRELPVGALLEFDDISGEWVKIKLPPNSDGFVIVGYIHVLYVEPNR
ncbi:MAG: SH3 domain-containing protein [Acidobacteriota bacterium]|nr:SH3 domain-containing protein [Acidobacteriota bacterium]